MESEIKIKEEKQILLEKKEEQNQSKKERTDQGNVSGGPEKKTSDARQRNGAALQRAFRNMEVKTPAQLKKEKEERIRLKIENAHKNLRAFLQQAGKTDPALRRNQVPAEVSQLNKRMEAAEKKEACRDRIKAFERIKQNEQENDLAQDTFAADCRALIKISPESFRIKNDTEFTENLEHNYALVKLSERVNRNLLKIAGGKRQDTLNPDQKMLLTRQIAFCREMKQWMDAKTELMKDPYYLYLAGKDIADRQTLKDNLALDAEGFFGPAGYRAAKREFLQYLTKLDRLDRCRVSRKMIKDSQKGKATALEEIVHQAVREVTKEHTLQENRLRLEKWEEEAAKNPGVAPEDEILTKEDKTIPERLYEQKKNEFLALSLSDLKCGSVEELLSNVSTNAPLIHKALEMQRILGQTVFVQDMDIPQNEIIELRAKINVILSVQRMQHQLLYRTYRSSEEELKAETPKEWMRRNGISPITDPNELFEQLKAKYTAESANAGAEANKIWTILNKGAALNEVSQQDRSSELQKNTLVWENLNDTFKHIGRSSEEAIRTLKKICLDHDLEYRLPENPILFYLRGRSEAEVLSIYRRYTGTPKERYLLYKEIVDKAKDEFIPRRFDFSNLSENGKVLQDLAHRSNLAVLLENAASCSEGMKAILSENPELALNENEAADEEWHKEAAALSKFSHDKLIPMLLSLQRLTDTRENRAVLSHIRFDELYILFMQRNEIRSWMNAQKNLTGETVDTVKKLLGFLDHFGSCELDMSEGYRSYRNAEHIDEDKLRSQQEYRRVRDMEADPARSTQEDLKILRRTCLAILNGKYTLDEAEYFKLDTFSLKELTLRCLKEEVPQENVNEVMLGILQKNRMDPEEELEDAKDGEWEEEERKVMELFCALSDGLKNRETAPEQRAEIFRTILHTHAETVAVFLTGYVREGKNSTIVSDMRKRLGRPEAQFLYNTHQELAPIFDWLQSRIGAGKITAANVESALADQNQVLKDALLQADEKINGHMETFFAMTEKSVSGWAEQAIGTEADSTDTGNLFEEKKKEEEKGEEEEEEKDIHELLKESLSKEKGEGKYITIAMKNYFRHSSKEDQRAMANAMLHELKPINQKASRSASAVKQAGRYLGGMLKGAGPLLQKLMQGIPEDLFLPELRRALDDVKSNLAPIPEDYVKNKLDEMKQKSGNKVKEIRVLQSLGAASVAETFLCRIYGDNLPTAGKDVVIKILRPGLKDRLEREKKILRVAARCTDDDRLDFDKEMEKPLPPAEKTKGMEATHITQVDKIMEELNMTIEVKNAKDGYDTYHSEKDSEVDTVKVNEDLPVMEDAYALDKAEGMTVERYLKQLQKKRTDVLAPFVLPGRESSGIHRIRPGQMELYEKTRSRLLRELETVMKKQRMLIKTAEKWTEQAIFGSNFYHGDMHAGNIMISDNKVTIIDYGNATKLTSDQRNHIMAMTTSSVSQNLAEDFLWSFTMLLPPLPKEPAFKRNDKVNEKDHPRLQGKGPEFLNKIKKILAMRDPQDPDNAQPGEKISLILKTAQEMGLQLPPEVENFSKSQLRLQNAIESFNHAVEEIRSDIKQLDQMSLQDSPALDLSKKIHNDANANRRRPVVTLLKDAINLFSPVSKEIFMEEIKKKDSKSREEFNNNYTAKYGGLLKKDSETGNMVPRLDLSSVPEWRRTFEELKKHAPKSEDEEKSPKYKELSSLLNDRISGVLGTALGGTDPLAAFGGILNILPSVFSKLDAVDLDGMEEIISLFENEVPAAVKLMQDYNALKESQDDEGFFSFNFFKSGKESQLQESIYENYLTLQKSRLNTSEVVNDFRNVLRRDYEYKIHQQDAIAMIPIRLHQQKGDRAKTEEAYAAYNALIRSLQEKYFKNEMEELDKETALWEKFRVPRLEAVARLHKESDTLSDRERAELEKIRDDMGEKMEPHVNRVMELQRVVDAFEKKLSPEEKKQLGTLRNRVQKEYDLLRMQTDYQSPIEKLEKEVKDLAKEKEGGKDFERAWNEYRTVQEQDIKLRLERKEVGADLKKLRMEKEKVLIELWQKVNLSRLKRHYKEAFETPETIYSDLTDYMKVTGDVVKRNKMKTLMSLGSVSTKLVGRLKELA